MCKMLCMLEYMLTPQCDSIILNCYTHVVAEHLETG